MNKEPNIYTISDIVESMVDRLCEKCRKYDCNGCQNKKTLEYVKRVDRRLNGSNRRRSM